MTQAEVKQVGQLYRAATRENLRATWRRVLRITGGKPNHEAEGYLEGLTKLWWLHFPGEPVPGSPAAEK